MYLLVGYKGLLSKEEEQDGEGKNLPFMAKSKVCGDCSDELYSSRVLCNFVNNYFIDSQLSKDKPRFFHLNKIQSIHKNLSVLREDF